MRFKHLLGFIIIAITSVPVIAGAQSVTWNSEQYRAYSLMENFTESEYAEDEKFGPPLPLSAGAYDSSGFADSSAGISDSAITVGTYNASGKTINVYGIGEFSGTFTASQPTFNFTYDYLYTCGGMAGGLDCDNSDQAFWLTVDDLTAGANLYSNTLMFAGGFLYDESGSDNIYVNTLIGNEVQVTFGSELASYTPENNYKSYGKTMEMTYSMSVAPEPISSILFVTGGTLLAGRRFMKRKNKARIV